MSCGHKHSPSEPCSAVAPLVKAIKILEDGNVNVECCVIILKDDGDFSLSDIPEVDMMTDDQKLAICFLVTKIMRANKMKVGERMAGGIDNHSLVIVKTEKNKAVFTFRTKSVTAGV